MSTVNCLKKTIISMLSFLLVLSLASCGEKGLAKEEYMATCESPLSFQTYKADPEKYVGKPYIVTGTVTYDDIQNADSSKEIYAINILTKEGLFWAGTHTVTDGEPYELGDTVTLYGDFIKLISTDDTKGVNLDIKYIESE